MMIRNDAVVFGSRVFADFAPGLCGGSSVMRASSSQDKKQFIMLIMAIVILATCGCDPFDHRRQPIVVELNERQIPKWHDEAKLGIFIHWGPYAIPAVGEWYWYNMTYDPFTSDYHTQTYGEDYPYEALGPQWIQITNTTTDWDPEGWAELFKQAGAKYVVLTTKHHDGFLLWPSEHSNPVVEDWQLERDVIGELADALRDQGMRFGAYYSGGYDWTFQYPSDAGTIWLFQSMMNTDEERLYAENHYRELIDRYRPDILWNDISYPKGDSFDYKWGMIRDYYDAVPDGIINDRFLDSSFIQGPLDRNPWLYFVLDWLLGSKRSDLKQLKETIGAYKDSICRNLHEADCMTVMTLFNHVLDETIKNQKIDIVDLIMKYYKPPHYDYLTMEFSTFEEIEDRKWERCRTLGGSWGYNQFVTADDTISGTELIHTLVDVVSKNGNLLINVGPTAEGIIPEIQKTPLLEMGNWLETNGRAIYETRPWSLPEGITDSEIPVRFTQKADEGKLYIIVLGPLEGREVTIKNLELEIESIEFLGVGPCHDWDISQGDLTIHVTEPFQAQPAYAFEVSLFSEADDDDDDDDDNDDDDSGEETAKDDDAGQDEGYLSNEGDDKDEACGCWQAG